MTTWSGSAHSRGRPWTDVELRSGVLLVFGTLHVSGLAAATG